MSQASSSEMISYPGATGNDVSGYLARPSSKKEKEEPLPAILLIHEIFGLVEHTRDLARRFASEGYAVLAPDLFSSSDQLKETLTEQNVSTMFQIMQKLPPTRDPDLVKSEIEKLPQEKREPVSKAARLLIGGGLQKDKLYEEGAKGVEFLKSQSYTNGLVGTIGYCFGGGISGEVACRTKTEACVIYYGANPEPIELVEKIQCPVLGIYGGEDTRINSNLDKLVSAMVAYKKDFEMKIYPGAPHAFFNDTSKRTYREEAAKDSWEKTLRFFKQTLFAKNNQG